MDPPADLRIDPALAERFVAALGRFGAIEPLGLAVSGGPDSMAMLALAAGAKLRCEVATVDHGLRPEAAEECALVGEQCAALGVPCFTLRVEVAPGNVQGQARAARYAALLPWAERRGLAAIATAHHADDQAETLLMRLNRGSGLAGLEGIRREVHFAGSAVRVVRPLLEFRRAELLATVAAADLRYARDPSNDDASFDRVRVRRALAKADWLDAGAIAHSAGLLGEANDFVAAQLRAIWNASVTELDDGFSCRPGRSRFEAVEIVGMILERMGSRPRKSEIAAMVDRLLAGRNASLAGVLATTAVEAEPGGEAAPWEFRPEPPRRGG